MSDSRVLPLPAPRLTGSMSVEEAIAKRRSVRRYQPQELTLEQIAQLLWSAQGITGRKAQFRAAPSAGGLHPLEFYLCRHDGIWHYEVEQHQLKQTFNEDVRKALGEASWKQTFIGTAPCVFAVSAQFRRSTTTYGERGRLRYVPMDLGHAAENLLLQAVALGLGAVVIAAFDDEKVGQILHLPANEEPLYLIPVGYPG